MPDFSARLDAMNSRLAGASVLDWGDIAAYLRPDTPVSDDADPRAAARAGVGFVTFDYGIDGVSIEIAKYADGLEELLSTGGATTPIHFIGGDFFPQADTVIQPRWKRFEIRGVNGWSKWDGGRWFSKLFYEDMPADSDGSRELAREIWSQAVRIAGELAAYVAAEGIGLLVPVNINSNPGNLAYALGMVLASEYLGVWVINSSHDYYWEGGNPARDKTPGEEPGVRDHFLRNIDNGAFWDLFTSLYPWNGERWLQVNINRLQTDRLLEVDGFAATRVKELATAISDKFFEEFDEADVMSARRRMGLILADGADTAVTRGIESHLTRLGEWMRNQVPVVVGARDGIFFDPTAAGLTVLLQPTRVIARKRIERDWEMLQALFALETFRERFESEGRSLQLHITGPTPIEHQADLEKVLRAYGELLEHLPATLAERVFLSFSVGNEEHPSFAAHGLERLTIEDIYRLANAVVFPSETEGRGLPIVESSACGVPIVCSRYKPEVVFADVVGEGRPEDEQIRTIHFPEHEYDTEFLDEMAALLLDPVANEARRAHNKAAVRDRYSRERLAQTFADLIDALGAREHLA